MRNEIFLSLLLGFLLDCLVGDPHSIPHPVVLIGKLISALEKGLRKLFPKTRAGEMTAGGILWVLTVAVSFWVPLGLLYLCGLVSPWLRRGRKCVFLFNGDGKLRFSRSHEASGGAGAYYPARTGKKRAGNRGGAAQETII